MANGSGPAGLPEAEREFSQSLHQTMEGAQWSWDQIGRQKHHQDSLSFASSFSLWGHFPQETESLAATGSGLSPSMTFHWRKVFPPLIGGLEVTLPCLDLSLKPEGGSTVGSMWVREERPGKRYQEDKSNDLHTAS